ALAQEITNGLTEPRAKAHALGDWVRKNIRYVAVYIGPGGVVPHTSETVMANRYGDCKDHVTLLEAMLASIGIDSTPALINLGNSYRLQNVPTLGVLNHVITYIPSLNLFLDSTAGPVAAGYLPASELDKPVVLTKTGQIKRTPATQKNIAMSTTEFRISAHGAADFNHSISVTGGEAEGVRYLMR
ncbi:MAG: transglutaminase domain-containing protein, partial [Betaproteobacteria bacterium]